jgi:hypothetical protein
MCAHKRKGCAGKEFASADGGHRTESVIGREHPVFAAWGAGMLLQFCAGSPGANLESESNFDGWGNCCKSLVPRFQMLQFWKRALA